MARNEHVAAVDLGSNSFHAIVARVVDDTHFHVVDRLRERVAIAAGLDEAQNLTDKIQARALACLERFGQRLRELPIERVRAVGTSALRQAHNSRPFLESAQAALGHPIEIIAGSEEARLIYLGVSHSLAEERGRRLVVDIGGGSTEVILGEHFSPLRMDSLNMGCVVFTTRFFADAKVRADDFKRAELAAGLKLEPIARRYTDAGWEGAVGSSGTILAIEALLRQHGWSERGITLAGLRQLKKALCAAGSPTAIAALPGVQADRAGVLPAGVSILIAVFEALGIDRMATTGGSIREGLLYDLLGRIRHEDTRDLTIRQMCQRYQVDLDQASRVERVAVHCLTQVAGAWGIDFEIGRQVLGWAARLHEIGLSVSYSGFHRHGAYLVANSDLPGFSRSDQDLLAGLLLGQRKKLGRDAFAALPAAEVDLALRLCVILRLAVRLTRSRSPRALPTIELRARKNALELVLPAEWVEAHPLTQADLADEAAKIQGVGFDLRLA